MKRILFAIVFTVTTPFANAQLPFDLGKALDIGKKVVQGGQAGQMSEDQEIALGGDITSAFLGAAPLSKDANLQHYVNRVGRWVSLHSGRPDLPWTFGVIETETLNAFAMPGGYVIVSSGLVKRLSSEAELAGVLAHEVAHVVKKHQLNAIQSGTWGDIGGDLAKSYAGDRIGRMGGGAAAGAVRTVGANAAIELVKNGALLRPLDRSMEYEADQLGVVIATRAGYDPYGLVGALEMLAQYKGSADGASILGTHPPPADRLAELEKMLPSLDRYASQPQLENRFLHTIGAAK